MPATCRPEELFTLDILSPHLTGFQPPQGPHEPAGDWRLGYRHYSLGAVGGIGSRVGTVQIGRKRLAGERFALDLDCQKGAPRRFVNKLAARIEARGGLLPEPVQWSWNAEIVDPSGAVLRESRLKRSARLARWAPRAQQARSEKPVTRVRRWSVPLGVPDRKVPRVRPVPLETRVP